ncbi:DUF192 domain-containing protein [Allorhodopirellula solitaria]|uniref:ACR n=1 Tax=Allorhodopirellula solitaria TaxID=2527987 RepID=A0A5C5YHU9_9BACT|nr:DUF192 domain-containing protein [Allorhodopirellula solitaria]TWT73332.1 hypothetical protein CA85_18010 [Allorhodopirellula solitaria]
MTKLFNTETGDLLLDDLQIADTFWKRFRGLQFRGSLPESSGLLLTPCSSIHTCWMRFSIDVIMLDCERCVLGIRTRVSPWRAVVCERGTAHVIEVRPGSVGVPKGARLDWNGPPSTG